ncbi:hypothetical protein [Marinomonas aquiplantarum]|uniref:Uncharacterized protein n=1 Tax=Marinomonas aquiplantarum TaxID=491951 RepID=A0A366CVJ1_9GAMM|nr:hypothetical protein [Marinomonas aquiplantarum]RBO81862.1 hypothetical protein DFP76_1075 [Marinomonas aquiplantarum]
MNEFNDELMGLNEQVMAILKELSQFKPRFYHAFVKGKLGEFAISLVGFREQLNDIDQRIRPHTRIPGDYNSIQMVSGKLSVTFSIRNVVLTTLDEAQKMLSSHEAQAGFKLSTNIALLAIIISVLGVAIG